MIKASSEKRDRVGEQILKSAYSENRPMLDDFISTGYLDWNHETDLIERKIRDLMIEKGDPADLLDLNRKKHEAIIGGPVQVGLRDDFPADLGLDADGFYCKGYLLPTNFHARKIIENVEAGFTGYGASISAYAAPGDVRNNVIKSLRLRKIAIQPRLDSINTDTWVEMAKSQDATLLCDIEKSTAYPTVTDGADSELDSRLDAMRSTLESIRRGQRAQTTLLLSIPKVAEAITDEIRAAIKKREVNMSSEEIRQYLIGLYFFDAAQATQLADLILMKHGAPK